MTGCRRQCDWDESMVCRSCGIDYGIVDDSSVKDVTPSEKEEE